MIIAVRVKVLYAVHGLLPQASLYYSKSIFLDSTSEFAASGHLQVPSPFICATVPGSFKFSPTNGTLVDTHTPIDSTQVSQKGTLQGVSGKITRADLGDMCRQTNKGNCVWAWLGVL